MMVSKIKVCLVVAVLTMFATLVFAQDFLPTHPAWWLDKANWTQKAEAKKTGKIYTDAELIAAMQLGADTLLQYQHTDGGWWWPEDFGSLTRPSPLNQFRRCSTRVSIGKQ